MLEKKYALELSRAKKNYGCASIREAYQGEYCEAVIECSSDWHSWDQGMIQRKIELN